MGRSMNRRRRADDTLGSGGRPGLRRSSGEWLTLLALGVLPFGLYAALYPKLYAGHQWQGDEVAFVFSSLTQSLADWFSEGYSRYFDVYPEWWVPATNFIRPFSNL